MELIKKSLNITNKKHVFIAVFLIAFFIITSSILFAGFEKERIVQQKEKMLATSAWHKTNNIESWFLQKFNDVRKISGVPFLSGEVQAYIKTKTPDNKARLSEFLNPT
jgi:hypothetical protein